MTAPRKAAPRKVVRPKAALPPLAAPEPEAEAPLVAERVVKSITVAGRAIAFYAPTLEQASALRHVGAQLSGAADGEDVFASVASALDAYYEQVYYLMVDPADEQWMRDGLRRGYVTVADPSVSGLIVTIMETFRDEIERWSYQRMTRPQKRAVARKRT